MVILCNDTYPSNSKYDAHFELYPYPLSSFQKYAIEGILTGNNVLVTAHTGSGKTLPAEFAIQHFVKSGKKVIYTSPIKALSNQKFYEFSQKYPEISFGLLTGDIKTNPTADVLIMTTEILMNYLFNTTGLDTVHESRLDFQIQIDRELGCVVFDEVHYINDEHRGQTWEQTILMLPPKIQMVMLSATIDNPAGFAEWVENREGSNPVYLASTEHRVVPLTHYGFFATTEKPFKEIKDKEVQAKIRGSTNRLVLLKSAEGQFSDKGYVEIKAMAELFETRRFFMKRKFVLNRLAEHLRENEMLPAIVFVFSRKAVEQCAEEITANLLEDDSKVPYIVQRECDQIIRKFSNYREYLELPEYVSLVKLLEKGIGIHHSGMMPVLREIVELMISKKYIKMLFATESFAIGLDCPIKTAVFSALKKFDGRNIRDLMAHEYTQMAGRAGRRGIDTVGHVVHCNNLFDLPAIQDYKTILCGQPQKLKSKFKITYSTVLNLMKSGQSKDYHDFVEKSMLKREIDSSIQDSILQTLEARTQYQKREFYMQCRINRTKVQ
jgi:antiviral helicase SKI2